MAYYQHYMSVYYFHELLYFFEYFVFLCGNIYEFRFGIHENK